MNNWPMRNIETDTDNIKSKVIKSQKEAKVNITVYSKKHFTVQAPLFG